MSLQCTLRTGDKFVRRSLGCNKHQPFRNSPLPAVLVRCSSSDSKSVTKARSFRKIPGPSALPFFGVAMHFTPFGELSNYMDDALKMFEKLHRDYGDMVRVDSTFGRAPYLVIYNPRLIEEVYRAEDTRHPDRVALESNSYFRQNFRTDIFRKYPGLVSSNGPKWKEFRSKVNPSMMQPKLVRASSELIDDVGKDMMKRLKTLTPNYLNSNFHSEMNRWALESLGVIALGTRLGCLDPNFSEDSDAGRMLALVAEIFALSYKLDMLPNMSKLVSTPNFKRAMRAYDEQLRLSTKFIEQGINRVRVEGEQGHERRRGDILAALYDLDPKVAYVMAVDMLLVGVDTTVNTAIPILYLLAKHPEKQEKLREEINAKNDRKPYLKACIKEATRLYSVTACNMRTLSVDMTLEGYNVPKGINCIFPNPYLSRCEKYFKNAKDFIPERWMVGADDPLYTGNIHPFTMIPFGYGARSCVGRRIAELELNVLITNFLKTFRLGWEGPDPNIRLALLNIFKPPFGFKLQPIENV